MRVLQCCAHRHSPIFDLCLPRARPPELPLHVAPDDSAHNILPLGVLSGLVSTEHHEESLFPYTPEVSFSPRKAKITPSIKQACCSFSKAHVHGVGISTGLLPHAEPPT